jgi:hypothetical protein
MTARRSGGDDVSESVVGAALNVSDALSRMADAVVAVSEDLAARGIPEGARALSDDRRKLSAAMRALSKVMIGYQNRAASLRDLEAAVVEARNVLAGES